MAKPFRFALMRGGIRDREDLITQARAAESIGFDTFALPDHLSIPFAPLIALQAAADATTTVRLSQSVLANDFRHPVVLTKEFATLDVLSGGRLEIGIGAGWMQAEYQSAGIPFHEPSVRIERLDEAIAIFKGLFADDPCTFNGKHFTVTEMNGTPKPIQQPHPPIMIGGGGRKLLSTAARCADTVQITSGPVRGTSGTMTAERLMPAAYEERVGWVREAAGERFGDLELGLFVMELAITDDAEQAEDAFLARLGPSPGMDGPNRAAALASPAVLIGSVEQVCDKLERVRETFGFSYLTPPPRNDPAEMAPLVERLAGT